jgi:pyruvate/2-oxoglutarate dehydrogenase complex dihydrolipoamide acyltransferase (E2) component
MRALEKDRDKRYQQMAEFEHDLERLLAGDSTVALREAAEPTQAPARHRLRWPLAALGVLALGAAIAVALAGGGQPQPAEAPVAPAPVEPVAPSPPPKETLVARPAPSTPAAPAVSERGRRVAKPHGPRASTAAASSGPGERGKKSKADDTVAPSPYQSDE